MNTLFSEGYLTIYSVLYVNVSVCITIFSATSPNIVQCSKTSSDSTIELLTKFYPILMEGQILYKKIDYFRTLIYMVRAYLTIVVFFCFFLPLPGGNIRILNQVAHRSKSAILAAFLHFKQGKVSKTSSGGKVPRF